MSDWSTLEDPKSLESRTEVARMCCEKLAFDFPMVVDTMDDRTAVRWSGWPERLFVISKEGRVVYAGDQGPFGFDPSIAYAGYGRGPKSGISLEAFLDAWLGAAKASSTATPALDDAGR